MCTLKRQREPPPDSDDVHALNEIRSCTMVAEDEAEAAVQCKASDADIKAGTDARQLVILVGQRVRDSPCLHSHLHTQSHM